MSDQIVFCNWAISRIVAHEIYVADEPRKQPTYGTSLLSLDSKAKDIFQERLQQALSNDSKSMEMEIEKTDDRSFFYATQKILSVQNNEEFIDISKQIADMLHAASNNRSIPGGLLLVFSGTVSAYNRAFVGALKAESQTGFTRRQTDRGPTLALLEELFLTPSAKMYKIGIFLENQAHADFSEAQANLFVPYVYDAAMSKSNRESSARYFYDTFLGCRFPNDSARMTKKFFELTKDFIFSISGFDEEKKMQAYAALQAYLRSAESQIHVEKFASTYLHTPSDRDAYKTWMRGKDFPTTALHKDTKDISRKLTMRKIKFGRDIRLTGPSDAMDQLVTVSSIQSPPDESGNTQPWTEITIRNPLNGAE